MAAVLLVFVLASHLLCMNLAASGPLVGLWLGYRGLRGDQLARRTGKQLASASLSALLVGSLLGLLVGFLLWDATYAAQVDRLWPKISVALWELTFSLVLMTVYVSWRAWADEVGARVAFFRGWLPFLAGTNLLYHFPLLFAVLSEADSGRIPGNLRITASAFRQLIIRGDILSRTVHFWLASFAVSGIFFLYLAIRDAASSPDTSRRLSVWGGRLALVPTFFQLAVGIWVLTQLPRPVQDQLLGGDLLAVTLLVTSVLLSIGLLHLLAAVASGDASAQSLRGAIVTLVMIVVLMTATLQRTKTRRHEPLPQDSRASQHLGSAQMSMSSFAVPLVPW